MRAAAFSYGVLQELNATTVPVGDRTNQLLTQVEAISAVSGGSFTAAYYCLNGDRTFGTFEPKVLKRDIERALIWRCLWPNNIVRLASPFYGRSDLAASYYDRTIFKGATFGDLAKINDRPFLVINATDLSTGSRFGFTQGSFDLIGSDLSTFPIARAVAASTAVPLILTPVTLRNYSHAPLNAAGPAETADDLLSDSLRRLLSDLNTYGDSSDRRYVHLIDGGVADDHGLRAFGDFTLLNRGLPQTLARLDLRKVDKVAIIVVDASIPF